MASMTKTWVFVFDKSERAPGHIPIKHSCSIAHFNIAAIASNMVLVIPAKSCICALASKIEGAFALRHILISNEPVVRISRHVAKIGPQCVHVWLTSAVVICNRSLTEGKNMSCK